MLRLLWLAALWLGLACARSSTGDSVLVVIDPSLQNDYSIFLGGLRDRGYQLTFRAPKDEAPVIIADGYPTFSHVVVFPGETRNFAKDLTPQALVELLQGGTNLILALSNKQTPLFSLAGEFSMILPPPGTPLVSYFPEREDPVTVVPIPLSAPASPIVPVPLDGPVWFSGIPHLPGNNPLLVPVLRAPVESFAADTTEADALVDAAEKGGEGLWAGNQLAVVSAFQATSGARVMWVGGMEMFSDTFAKRPGAANKRFVQDLAAWTFQETGVYRIDSSTHHLVNETEERETYTINDNVEYVLHVSEFDPAIGEWKPCSSIQDMQFEFTMLDPHIRTALRPVPGVPGEYAVTFRVPDRHGVFKFVVNYKRKGYTHLLTDTTVPVVPPRHNQYPRFLSAAWPYYAGAISTSLAFVVFSAMWLGGEEPRKKKTE
ncbi:Dolichyl-diphosphooligosaccharide-protein glycosyltransferase 48kDa subunit [Fistulina hepatica ATCC 64428]|uniref:Dolichyl-diphosphooligosaccharide--protein glycosyltransferase subunit WBP1 n=1 Tax=Fistulina hepatica ATCC 64428 TaxID=1128425 RepID=A0A0D7ABT8_9AGAR|nr:Dolichyl-diphosphooligosaccharide-protein glycosyltransferase 48kDa subunit [Fistulina hepatica ATCC 64428]